MSDLFAEAPRRRVPVLFPLPLEGSYDYLVPEDLDLSPGAIVMAPLGKRDVVGVVWDDDRLTANPDASPPPDDRLKDVVARPPVPALRDAALRFIEWVAAYYVVPPGRVLRMALSAREALQAPPRVQLYRLAEMELAEMPDGLRSTPARLRVLEAAADGLGRSLGDLARTAGVSTSVVKGLQRAGVLEVIEAEQRMRFATIDAARSGPDLSPSQAAAAEALRGAVTSGGESVTLLDGVTGSGKTEVYFEAVAEAVAEGRQVLVLLPEIALTEPFLKRFHDRFGCEPVAWHSGLRSSQRRRAWRAIASGQGLVTVGARSALFLPYRNLGLIVVDEAHETSFKQEDGVHYHARDVAVMRGKFEPCPVILASATPAIETRQQVALGRYTEVKLPGRFGPAQMPTIEAIDLIQNPPERGRWIAPKLVAAMKETLEKREQSLLYLNRRGYAPLTLCRTCGHRFQCPNCTAWMVEHRLVRRLACHHCGHVMPTPRACPECGGEDSLVACGPGVERIADEATALFPEAKIAVVTSDTIWSPAKAAEFVGRMEAGDIDIVVGTQLITKGYHFPNLTLVGVIDADLGLDGGDLRAAERTFQQIRQVSGRAGRGAKPGHVFIQTHSPKAQVMQALVTGDAEAFYSAETEARRNADAPPFGRYAAIIVSSEDQGAAQSAAEMIARAAPKVDGMHVFGPAPAPLAMLRGRHRFRLLVHARRALAVQDVIREWLGGLEWSAKVRVAVDVDPYSFL